MMQSPAQASKSYNSPNKSGPTAQARDEHFKNTRTENDTYGQFDKQKEFDITNFMGAKEIKLMNSKLSTNTRTSIVGGHNDGGTGGNSRPIKAFSEEWYNITRPLNVFDNKKKIIDPKLIKET